MGHVGDNCFVMGNGTGTGGHKWCLVIGDGMTATEDYMINICTGAVQIRFVMPSLTAKIIISALQMCLRTHYDLPASPNSFIHMTRKIYKQEDGWKDTTSYCGGCGFVHAPNDCPKRGDGYPTIGSLE